MLERIKSTSEVEVPFCQPCCTPSGRTSPLWPPYITGHTQHQGFISLKRQCTQRRPMHFHPANNTHSQTWSPFFIDLWL